MRCAPKAGRRTLLCGSSSLVSNAPLRSVTPRCSAAIFGYRRRRQRPYRRQQRAARLFPRASSLTGRFRLSKHQQPRRVRHTCRLHRIRQHLQHLEEEEEEEEEEEDEEEEELVL